MSARPEPNSCPNRVELEEYARQPGGNPNLPTHLADCPACMSLFVEIEAENALLRGFTPRRAAAPQRPAIAAPQIDGYSILAEIHHGGQGVVYRAIQQSTRREVAIKVMREGPFAGRNDRIRFDREVHILAQLEHPNIVTIHDSGTASGCYFFVMDYIRGRTLDDYLSIASAPTRVSSVTGDHAAPATGGVRQRTARKPVTHPELETRLRLFIKICEAVNAAHLRGVIHRDLKPGNIMVDDAGEPHVLDFGLARVTWAEDSAPSITLSAHFVGTPQWASPEQAAGDSARVDLRSDVYSLGLILYHLLTGEFPYDVRGALPEIIQQIRTANPRPLTSLSRGLDAELNTLVLKCLAKEPERRYETAGALARDVARYLAHEPLDARRDSVWYVLRKRFRRHRLPLALGAASFVALIAFAITMSFLYRRAVNAEQVSSATAGQLANQLSISNIERARALGSVGSIQLAEDLLWGELLVHSPDPPGIERGDAAFWSILELYARNPCLGTRALDRTHSQQLIQLDAASSTATFFSERGEIEHWDVRRMTRLTNIAVDLADQVKAAGVSADRGWMLQVSPNGGRVYLRDLRTGVLTETGLDSAAGTHTQFALMPSGRWIISASDDGGFSRWSVSESGVASAADHFGATPDKKISLRSHRTLDWLTAYTPAGYLEVWDLTSSVPRLVWSRSGISGGGNQLSPDTRRIAFNDETSAMTCIASLTGAGADVNSNTGLARSFDLDFDPAMQHVAAVGTNSTEIILIDAQTGAIQTLAGHRDICGSVRFLPDGKRLISSSQDGALKLWDLPNANPGARQRACPGTVLAVRYDHAGDSLLASTGSGSVCLLNPDSLAIKSEIPTHSQPVAAALAGPAGDWLATCGYDGVVKLWNLPDQSLRAAVESTTHDKFIALDYSPQSGDLAASCEDGFVYLWNVRTLQHQRVAGHGDQANCVAFSRDGRWLASGDRHGLVILRDAQSLGISRRIQAVPARLRTLAFSPDSRTLATGGEDRRVKLWSVADGSLITSLEGHREPVFALAFRPDGKVLASGDTGGVITLWNIAERRNLLQFHAYRNAVFSLAFSPSGAALASGGSNQIVTIHDLAYLERYILGNMDAAIDRLGPKADPNRVARLREWADRRGPFSVD